MRDETVYVVGSEEFADECVEKLYPEFRVLGNSEDPAEAKRAIKEWQPSTVLVDGDGLDHPVKAVQAVAGANSNGMLFVVAMRPTPDLVRGAISAGARDVIQRPVTAESLKKAIQQAEEEMRRRLGRYAGSEEEEGEQGGGRRRPGRSIAIRQQLIAVFSPKGGSGKTTMAINLAAAYAWLLAPDGKVLLMECDPYGNIPTHLQWGGVRHSLATWRDLEGDGSDIGWPVVQQHVNQDSKTKMYVLPMPPNIVDATAVDAETVRRALMAGRRHFDVVVTDCSSDLTQDATLVALQMATRVLVVVPPDIPALNRLVGRGKVGELLASDVIGVDPGKIRIVLNRVPKKADVPIKDLVRRLPFRLAAVIPEDPLVQAGLNNGKVAVLSWPNCPFSREVRKLAGIVVPEATQRQGGGLLARLFGGRR